MPPKNKGKKSKKQDDDEYWCCIHYFSASGEMLMNLIRDSITESNAASVSNLSAKENATTTQSNGSTALSTEEYDDDGEDFGLMVRTGGQSLQIRTNVIPKSSL